MTRHVPTTDSAIAVTDSSAARATARPKVGSPGAIHVRPSLTSTPSKRRFASGIVGGRAVHHVGLDAVEDPAVAAGAARRYLAVDGDGSGQGAVGNPGQPLAVRARLAGEGGELSDGRDERRRRDDPRQFFDDQA